MAQAAESLPSGARRLELSSASPGTLQDRRRLWRSIASGAAGTRTGVPRSQPGEAALPAALGRRTLDAAGSAQVRPVAPRRPPTGSAPAPGAVPRKWPLVPRKWPLVARGAQVGVLAGPVRCCRRARASHRSRPGRCRRSLRETQRLRGQAGLREAAARGCRAVSRARFSSSAPRGSSGLRGPLCRQQTGPPWRNYWLTLTTQSRTPQGRRNGIQEGKRGSRRNPRMKLKKEVVDFLRRHLRRDEKMAQVLWLRPPTQKTRREYLALAWHRTGSCGHSDSEPAQTRSLFASLQAGRSLILWLSERLHRGHYPQQTLALQDHLSHKISSLAPDNTFPLIGG
ncbi:uncharacterized protein [Oryctolagus cuniculus]